MRRTDPLNDRQLAVLQWVADGHPADAMQGNMYKRTAAALQDRRLVKISRAGGNWSAVLTEAGQHYLAHGSFPADVGSTAGRAADARPSPRKQASAAVLSSQSSPSRPRSSTEHLVADVLAAGGVLEEAELDRATRNRLSELVKQVNRFGKAPAGKRLVRRSIPEPGGGYYPRRWQVVLEDGPAGTDAPLVPVAVPAEVRRYHPAVAALRKGDELRIKGEARARALRVLQAIATEAERRDYTVRQPTAPSRHERRAAAEVWHLLLTHDDDTVPLRVTEETDRVEHVPTARELAEQRRYAWTRIPSHDSVPSGRLRIDVGGLWQAERRSFWADRQSWQLEDKLPEAFREIAVRLDELQQLRQARDAAQIEYQAAVEQEEARARERAAEAHRVTALDEQLGRWREVGELRRYAEAVRERIELAANADGQDADALATAQRWLVWIDQRVERRDPLQQLPTMPEPPRLPSYKLAEFMRRVPEPEHFRYRPPEY